MEKIFEKYGFNLSEEQLKSFEKFKDLLIECNEKFNITSITEEREIYIKHFVDSIICSSVYNVDKRVIDIGSGGGFPMIPLKIVRPDLNITMVEATQKKCNFLKEVICELKLKNIQVINGRAEDLAKDKNYREKFDYGTARAVARLNTLCEYVIPFVKEGGEFISYKGISGLEELEEATNAIKVLGGKFKEIKKYLIEENERNIVIIEKIKNTPTLYPRGKGKERSKPL